MPGGASRWALCPWLSSKESSREPPSNAKTPAAGRSGGSVSARIVTRPRFTLVNTQRTASPVETWMVAEPPDAGLPSEHSIRPRSQPVLAASDTA